MLPFYEHRDTDFHAFEWTSPHAFLPHIHPQLELMYVVEGGIDATVNFREYALRAGDLAVIFPHTVHSFRIPDPIPPHHRIWGMVISPTITGDFEPMLSQFSPDNPFLSAEQLGPEAHEAIRQMFTRHYQNNPLLTRGYLQVLLAQIWKDLQPQSTEGLMAEDMLHRLIEYILSHYRQPLHADDVAKALGISHSYLARILSKRLGMNFNEYVNRMRVQAAQELLTTTEAPVTQVMGEVGFESQATFNRVFREITGQSPREYRTHRQK